MSRVEQTIDVDVPVRVAYDQWTQFEEFPRFMDGIERVVQRGDKYLDWTATVGGRRKDWTAEITDQEPDSRVAWKAVSGAENAGAVLFEAVDDTTTRVTLRMEAEPEGAVESVGDAIGVLDRQVKGDLERFKELVESRGSASGGWRGEIHGDEVREPAGQQRMR
jgi:uncharacterized membrane protein